MQFTEIECSGAVAEKLWCKHRVDPDEINEVLNGETHVRRTREGLYQVLGRTEAGRYLTAIVKDLGAGKGRLITARAMDEGERRCYHRR